MRMSDVIILVQRAGSGIVNSMMRGGIVGL